MRRILVTGANKGIGLAIANAILAEQADTFVVLGSRSAERGRNAAESLTERNPGWADRLAVIELDVASDASVARAAAETARRFAESAAPLYALVNNAGIGRGSLREVLDVNAFGIRRASRAFAPLVDAQRGRVVNVTSAAGPTFVSRCSPERQRLFVDRNVTWEQLEALMAECLRMEGDADAFAARGLADGNTYGLSKACANAYTRIFAREHPNLRVNACTPGFIETDMTRPYLTDQGKTAEELGMKPPAAGARAPMFLLFGEPEGSGRYYGSDAQRSPLDRYRAPGDPPYTGE